MVKTVLKVTPRSVKDVAKRIMRVGTKAWIRGRLWLHGVPAAPEEYDAFTVKLASEFDCRLPVSANLGNGLTIQVALGDHVSRHILRDGYYEPDTVALFDRFLKAGMVVLDIGAHIGQYSLVASRLVGDSGQVHSFEPDPDTYAWLRDNCRRNSLTNVRLNQLALSDTAETRTLYFSMTADIGANSLAEPKRFSGRKAAVRCLRLDDYLRMQSVGRVHLVKMDVEGAELAVLRGAERLFSGPMRPMLVAEFEEERQVAFGSSCRVLAEWLVQRGYQLFRIGSELRPYTPSAADPPSVNVLAMPETS
jgi:FkbM family methyltransferase